MAKGVNKGKENQTHKAATDRQKEPMFSITHNEMSDRATSAEGSQLLKMRGNMSLIFQL